MYLAPGVVSSAVVTLTYRSIIRVSHCFLARVYDFVRLITKLIVQIETHLQVARRRKRALADAN
jgi:hypothetical protein